MTEKEIKEKLIGMQDIPYGNFQRKLIPTVPEDRIIGVRTDALKKFAKELVAEGGYEDFLGLLPHCCFEEDQLHSFMISEIKDYDMCAGYVRAFLPYVNNWATCDQLNPVVFKKNKEKLISLIDEGLLSEHTYTVRFSVRMLMCHYLDEDFKDIYAEKVASVDTSDYYLSMMVAWYFATALAKQYDRTVSYIENNKLDIITHNRTIQKAVESDRIPSDVKTYLRSLKRHM